MTKRNFEALADGLAKIRPERPDGQGREEHIVWGQWLLCRDALADVCAAANPRFDREKFIKACETR